MCAGITQGLKDAATVSASWYWNPPGLPRGEMAFRGEIFQL
jgi:hypothetical protein